MRKPEWEAAEEALIEACDRAEKNGMAITFGSFGLALRGPTYEPTGSKVCPIGAYLLGKEARNGNLEDFTEDLHLEDMAWSIALYKAFDGTECLIPDSQKKDPAIQDGIETGRRLRDMYIQEP